MTCDQFRELISADLDGELGVDDTAALDDHLAECATCVAYQDQARSLRRSVRLDLAHQLGTLPPVDVTVAGRLTGVSALRYALFVIGGTLIALNVGNLLGTGGLEDHVARHDGVFGAALGVGMISVAWRPHRAIGLVPVTSAVAMLMAMVAIRDLVGDNASMLAEAVHLIEFAGLACLWIISGGVARAQDRISTLLATRGRPSVPSWPTR